MSVTKKTSLKTISTRTLTRVIVGAAVLLLVAVGVFGGYYYWDRYTFAGDKSPLELDIEHLESAIREDPQNPETRVALAQYYLGKGLYKDALAQAGQVLNAFPDNDGALLVAGIAHVRLNDMEPAIKNLEQFVAARKDQPMANVDTTLEAAYYFLGESYLNQNRPEEAIPNLEGALTITPTDADALYKLGMAYQTTGRAEAALEKYHKAVRLVPDFVEAYTGMIASYSSLNQPSYVAYARGMQAFSLQDFNTAQTHLEAATEALPDFAPAFLGLGLTYEKIDMQYEALQTLERAIELNPNDFAAQQAYARIQAVIDGQNIQ